MKFFLTHNMFNLSKVVSNFIIKIFTVTNRISQLFGGFSYIKKKVPFLVLKDTKGTSINLKGAISSFFALVTFGLVNLNLGDKHQVFAAKGSKVVKEVFQTVCKNKPPVSIASNFTDLGVELKIPASVDKVSRNNLIPGDELIKEAIHNKEKHDTLDF